MLKSFWISFFDCVFQSSFMEHESFSFSQLLLSFEYFMYILI